MRNGLNYRNAVERGLHVKRRRFLFWVGFGLFSLGEKLRLTGFDELAKGNS